MKELKFFSWLFLCYTTKIKRQPRERSLFMAGGGEGAGELEGGGGGGAKIL